jgi:hypothetical protein
MQCLQVDVFEDDPSSGVSSLRVRYSRYGDKFLTSIYRLTEHASNKHSKTLEDCFPNFVAATK